MEMIVAWLDAFTLSNESWTSLIGLCLTLLAAAMWCKHLLYPRFVSEGDFEAAVKAYLAALSVYRTEQTRLLQLRGEADVVRQQIRAAGGTPWTGQVSSTSSLPLSRTSTFRRLSSGLLWAVRFALSRGSRSSSLSGRPAPLVGIEPAPESFYEPGMTSPTPSRAPRPRSPY
ncbi:MAG: hypothetical protein IPO08_21910 [Xanthomonadales bacterium]|nr:hypothetical protein [Xanthomonadales bacterium]